ncbi:hypothetical protein ON010_g13379 [Phytophthora cinnamomi]|nr:hypothetical protein ON010_g13379 [Phytophthora cinnamomi]
MAEACYRLHHRHVNAGEDGSQRHPDSRARTVSSAVKRVTMSKQMEAGNAFVNYPHARYETNIKFQVAYRPSGRFT